MIVRKWLHGWWIDILLVPWILASRFSYALDAYIGRLQESYAAKYLR